jgi:hypothetical protein
MSLKPVANSLFLSALVALLSPGCSEKRPVAQNPSTEQQQPAAMSVPKFDGSRAFAQLEKQVGFGPRVPNTPAHMNCLGYLENEMRRYADAVELQPFTHPGYDGNALELTNLIASFNLKTASRILLCAHWDSRPRADQDSNPQNRSKPVPGANDGASGVAVLLEIARILKSQPPPIGVDVVLFDGEDYGKEGDLDNYLLGSRYFAHNKPSSFLPMYGILLDMVGDAQLEIPKERNSLRLAPDIVDLVWSVARDVGSTAFVNAAGQDVFDDHIPLNQVGIKTIDLIDFHYPDETHMYWHTVEDTPDKCAPESLEQVGTVLLHLIYRRSP